MRKNPHVRIRGGLGSVTALVYPTPRRRVCRDRGPRRTCGPCALTRCRVVRGEGVMRGARRRRWASVRRSGRGPRCSRRTRFSSRR